MRQMSFVKACKEHFGLLEGQTLGDFANELKCLTDKDRLDLCDAFRAIEIEITDPVKQKP